MELTEAERRKRLGDPMRLAADPALPPEMLAALFERVKERTNRAENRSLRRGEGESSLVVRLREEERIVCRALAGNPNCPSRVLARLVGRFPDEFCANPVSPLLLLEDPDFFREVPARDLHYLLRRVDIPPIFLQAVRRCIHWPAAQEEASLHVLVSGEAGDDWRECVAGVLAERVPLLSKEEKEQMAFLLAAGAAPAWLANRLGSEGRLPAAPALGEREVAALLRRATPPAPSFSTAALHRCVALMHPEVEASTLGTFAGSYWWPGRLAVALNPNVSALPDVLASLTEDGNRYVRAAARARMRGEGSAL